MKKTSMLCLLALITFGAQANDSAPKPYGFTKEQNAFMARENQTLAQKSRSLKSGQIKSERNIVPYAEYERAGYLVINEDFHFGSAHIKYGLAQHLPQDVTLVVVTASTSSTRVRSIRNKFSRYIDGNRLKVLSVPSAGNPFWMRDAAPVPMNFINYSQERREFAAVDARYYHKFEGDKKIADTFNARLISHNYYYEGGNFMANSRGDCLVVNKTQTKQIPNSIFTGKYGCKKLIRLPHLKGIGHADESVKFISDNKVMTDLPQYHQVLKDHGFDVISLPRPRRPMETYVNSLIVNGTLFLPVFGQSKDQSVISSYERQGFKVVPLNSVSLSNRGQGSIHCITMTYPPVSFQKLKESFGAIEL